MTKKATRKTRAKKPEYVPEDVDLPLEGEEEDEETDDEDDDDGMDFGSDDNDDFDMDLDQQEFDEIPFPPQGLNRGILEKLRKVDLKDGSSSMVADIRIVWDDEQTGETKEYVESQWFNIWTGRNPGQVARARKEFAAMLGGKLEKTANGTQRFVGLGSVAEHAGVPLKFKIVHSKDGTRVFLNDIVKDD